MPPAKVRPYSVQEEYGAWGISDTGKVLPQSEFFGGDATVEWCCGRARCSEKLLKKIKPYLKETQPIESRRKFASRIKKNGDKY